MPKNKQESLSGTITRTYEVDADADRVFEAFTKKKDLEMWMADHYEIEAKRGGKFKAGSESEGTVITGEFLEVEPDSKLVYSWVMNEYDPQTKKLIPSWMQENPSKVTVKFEKKPGKKTRIVLVHEGFPDRDENFYGHEVGWDLLVGEVLKVYLEKSPKEYELWWKEREPSWNDRWQKLIRERMST